MSELINSLKLHNKSILDIGCFDGTLLKRIKGKNKLYGLDASNFAINKCKKKKINVMKFYIEDDKPLPYRSHQFDLVIAGELIEHLYDTDFFLQEVKRILMKNGYFLLSTPNIASLGRRIFLLFGRNPIIETSPNEPLSSGHIRYFTFNSLKTLLEKNGFKIVKEQSDKVNFSQSGVLKSMLLAQLNPRLGQSIIMLCRIL